MFTLLFFDDWYLSYRTNLTRRVGQPSLVPEGVFEDPYADVAWGYPTVYQDPATGRWRCLYQGEPEAGKFVPLTAGSDDGVHWRASDLTDKLDMVDRFCPHQLLAKTRFGEWSPPFVDPHAAGTDAWLKGLVVHRDPGTRALNAYLVTSPDGIQWEYEESVRWQESVGDPISAVFWNPYRESYVITTRPALNDRRIALSETRDWRTYSQPELALQPDALDTPCAQAYGMPVFQYEHMFVGLLWIYHTTPVIDAEQKFLQGKIDCYLAYSYNGWHFQRTVREPFVPNGAPGEHGSGCIYPSSMVVDGGGSIRIYSSSAKSEHGGIRKGVAGHQSALLLHELRPDGFVYLSPDGGQGELSTRLLLWDGGEAQLNVSAPHGEVRAQVADAVGAPIEGYAFEDCVPFSGDDLAWEPEWREGRRLDALKDRILRLQVRLTNGRLYAIRGEFEVKMSHEARQFTEGGVRTPRRMGF